MDGGLPLMRLLNHHFFAVQVKRDLVSKPVDVNNGIIDQSAYKRHFKILDLNFRKLVQRHLPESGFAECVLLTLIELALLA